MRHAGVTICGRPIRPIKSRKLNRSIVEQTSFSSEKLKQEEVVADTIEVIIVDTEGKSEDPVFEVDDAEEPRPLIVGTGSYLNIPKEVTEEGLKEDKAYSSPVVETTIEVLGKIVEEETKKEKKPKKKRKYIRQKKSKKSTVTSEQD